jgi:DNA invertase Pin-like site-specific DNA recombinase
MRVVAYLRVASILQVDAWGLDRQEAAIRATAKRDGHRIVDWKRDEGRSGTLGIAERDGLTEAVAMIGAKADGLIVADLDRLARDLMVQEAVLGAIWKAGGHVITPRGIESKDDPDGTDGTVALSDRASRAGPCARPDATQQVLRCPVYYGFPRCWQDLPPDFRAWQGRRSP